MILVTGSAGKTGRSVVQALVEKGIPVRACVHHPDQVDVLKALGAGEVLVGDMRSVEDMRQAATGVNGVYHIPPNMSPDEVQLGTIIISAAQSAGVEHFVFHSVLKPQVQAMPHHWNKMLVEEQLIQSGLPYTILQPAAYMQNILAYWESITKDGIYPLPYPADTLMSLVDLDDIAQAASIVITEKGHQFAIYELVGTGAISQNEVAAALSQELQRPVEVSSVSLDQWAEKAHQAGLGAYQIETLLDMFTFYRQFGLQGNTRVLSWLLGRDPGSLQEFIRRSRSRYETTPI